MNCKFFTAVQLSLLPWSFLPSLCVYVCVCVLAWRLSIMYVFSFVYISMCMYLYVFYCVYYEWMERDNLPYACSHTKIKWLKVWLYFWRDSPDILKWAGKTWVISPQFCHKWHVWKYFHLPESALPVWITFWWYCKYKLKIIFYKGHSVIVETVFFCFYFSYISIII